MKQEKSLTKKSKDSGVVVAAETVVPEANGAARTRVEEVASQSSSHDEAERRGARVESDSQLKRMTLQHRDTETQLKAVKLCLCG